MSAILHFIVLVLSRKTISCLLSHVRLNPCERSINLGLRKMDRCSFLYGKHLEASIYIWSIMIVLPGKEPRAWPLFNSYYYGLLAVYRQESAEKHSSH